MSRFKVSVGPWNVHTGADSYGPETRKPIDLEAKFAKFAAVSYTHLLRMGRNPVFVSMYFPFRQALYFRACFVIRAPRRFRARPAPQRGKRLPSRAGRTARE